MIGQIRGTLVSKQPPEVLVDVQGVGYEIQLPMTCFYQLPATGEPVTLVTHFVVREDAQLLYGFNSLAERSLFRLLIKTQGVGPKLALAILSGMNADEFVWAVNQNDVSRLVKLPGVGKKTAERLVIEMRDRLKDWQVTNTTPVNDSMPLDLHSENTLVSNVKADATNALISLGYSQQQADKAIRAVFKVELSSEDLIRDALKAML